MNANHVLHTIFLNRVTSTTLQICSERSIRSSVLSQKLVGRQVRWDGVGLDLLSSMWRTSDEYRGCLCSSFTALQKVSSQCGERGVDDAGVNLSSRK
jgi:hypothetical protein